MAVIYATKKLLDRVTSWGSPTLSQADALPEQGVFSDWYGTYAIIAKQHMVVLVNMSTYLTVVIPAKEFKRSQAGALRASLDRMLQHLSIPEETWRECLSELDTVLFAPTRDRSMVSRLNHVLRDVSWRIEDRRSPYRINLEMSEALYPVHANGSKRYEDYVPARELLMLELGLERPEKRVRFDLVEVRIALADLEPEIWRSVLLPVTNDLHDLNLAILGCMGWTGFREHAFYRGQDLIENEFDVVLADLVGDTERPLRYLYDPGDKWEHIITFGQVVPWSFTVSPEQVTGGERAVPPEGIGGAAGYLEFLSAWSNPTHPMYNDYMSWRKAPFDPEAFDLEEIQSYVHGMMRYG